MCIALFSTAHPKYALIVITNRDEYIRRPTARAAWWDSPSTHVLGGRDLERSVRGTWLGITSDGRIATLTNFRDEASLSDAIANDLKAPPSSSGLVSRGAMVNAYLTQPPGQVQDTETFARKLVTGEGAKGSGGFTLVCGQMGSPLAVVSNRMADVGEVAWIAGERGQTVGLSNAAFGDTSWPKVVEGEELMADIIKKHVEKYTSGANNKEGQDQDQDQEEEALIKSLLTLLSRDTLPTRQDNEGWATYVKTLKQSIFIPVVGGEDPTYYGDEIASGRSGRRMSVNRLAPGSYATSKQNVILVDHEGNVTFVEKTLYEDCLRVRGEKEQVRRFRYKVQVPGSDQNRTGE